MTSLGHTSVTSDDMVTVTSHMIKVASCTRNSIEFSFVTQYKYMSFTQL